MFVDRLQLIVEGGRGGNGCRSFHVDALRRKIPDGGWGGAGGRVVLRVDEHCGNFNHLIAGQLIVADSGLRGGSNHKAGASGKEVVVQVPPGTLVKDAATDLLLRDLCRPGETLEVALGGKGGVGNARHRDSTAGEPGEKRRVVLELKLLADLGFVGLPNSGKSSLLARLSKAHPKVAAYPFTTLRPMVGWLEDETRPWLTLVDIPGLVEGAHQGRGLGFDFLRHIERTHGLLHVVDMGPWEGLTPGQRIRLVHEELEQYQPSLSTRVWMIIANKMDLEGASERLAQLRQETSLPVWGVSAMTGAGLDELKQMIFKKWESQSR